MQRCFTCTWRVVSATVLLTYSITPTGESFGLSRLANSRDPRRLKLLLVKTVTGKDIRARVRTKPTRTHLSAGQVSSQTHVSVGRHHVRTVTYESIRTFCVCIMRVLYVLYVCYPCIYIYVVTVNGLEIRSKFSECNRESSH